jgi:hypothetical protein
MLIVGVSIGGKDKSRKSRQFKKVQGKRSASLSSKNSKPINYESNELTVQIYTPIDDPEVKLEISSPKGGSLRKSSCSPFYWEWHYEDKKWDQISKLTIKLDSKNLNGNLNYLVYNGPAYLDQGSEKLKNTTIINLDIKN